MPKNRDLKRLVRARMEKTGESYTAARAQLVAKRPAAKEPAAKEPAHSFVSIAKKSDEKMKEATGRDWAAWVKELDAHGGREMKHRDIARLVNQEYEVPGWWAQTVTVGYERIVGRREENQLADGKWQVSRSRTIGAPISKLYAAFTTKRGRDRWLGDVALRITSATPKKYVHIAWPGGSVVDVGFVTTRGGKCQVSLGHRKLTSKAQVAELGAFWAQRLDALRQLHE